MSSLVPPLYIQRWSNNQVRLYWSANFPDVTLQYALFLAGPWANLNLPVNLEPPDFAVYDTIGPTNKFYRLIP